MFATGISTTRRASMALAGLTLSLAALSGCDKSPPAADLSAVPVERPTTLPDPLPVEDATPKSVAWAPKTYVGMRMELPGPFTLLRASVPERPDQKPDKYLYTTGQVNIDEYHAYFRVVSPVELSPKVTAVRGTWCESKGTYYLHADQALMPSWLDIIKATPENHGVEK